MSGPVLATKAGDLDMPLGDCMSMVRILASLIEEQFGGVPDDAFGYRVSVQDSGQITWAVYHSLDLMKHLERELQALIAAGAQGGRRDGAS
jgi:hypothetical protein